MLRRIQQLRISLAAKCQLLFGAAVLLIIAAALFVPWHRIEQLTEQLNERTASAVIDYAIAAHVRSDIGRPPTASSAQTEPTTQTQPTTQALPPNVNAPRPRLVSLAPRRDTSDIGRFEARAVNHFLQSPDSAFYATYYDRRDGTVGYRYARTLEFRATCAACHRPVALADAKMPDTLPAVAQSGTEALVPLPVDPLPVPADNDADFSDSLAGVVSVDFASRIDANQLLLNRGFILAALLLASFLAIVTFYYITTRLILQPVRVLQETAEKVAKGDLNIRSDISTGDEFQQLSETFNTMLTNLKASSDQLRQMNMSLDLKLGQLAESNVALFESNRLKSEFLANVSHELRTPLNSILGFADLLKEASTEGKSQRYISNILTSGRHLLELINDLLDLAKIEAGKMEVRAEPLSVSDMFEGLTNLLRPLLEQKKLTLTATVAREVPILQTDPGKLQQVLYNFLSNAIKFSPPGGAIELKATLEQQEPQAQSVPNFPDGAGRNNAAPAGWANGVAAADAIPATPRLPRPDRGRPASAEEPQVRISVIDRGPGIAADQQNVIFEKFRQVEAGVTRTHSGTGLGLAISKELMLLMGGTIGVKSKVNEGATFWVLLPLRVTAGVRDVRPATRVG